MKETHHSEYLKLASVYLKPAENSYHSEKQLTKQTRVRDHGDLSERMLKQEKGPCEEKNGCRADCIGGIARVVWCVAT